LLDNRIKNCHKTYRSVRATRSRCCFACNDFYGEKEKEEISRDRPENGMNVNLYFDTMTRFQLNFRLSNLPNY